MLVDGADAQPVGDVTGAVIALGEAEKVRLLQAFDPLQHLGVLEEASGFLERQQMPVKVFDHRIHVLPGHFPQARQRLRVLVAKFKEGLHARDVVIADCHLLAERPVLIERDRVSHWLLLECERTQKICRE